MKDLYQTLKTIGAIQEGDFVLKGGQQSSVYFDIKKAYGDPCVFAEIVEQISTLVPNEATCVAGSGHGGIPLAAAVAYKLRKQLAIVRDVAKEHGTKKAVDGYTPEAHDNMVIVDDVLSSGTSLRNTIKHLGDTTILKCIVVIKRGEAKDIPYEIAFLEKGGAAAST